MTADRRKPYPFDELEPKWQRLWEERQTFHTPNPGEPGFDAAKPKYCVLDGFPAPSSAGLRLGQLGGCTAMDIVARYRRMKGHNVLHPIVWDAEEHAPARNSKQLRRLGLAYDWQREIDTGDPGYGHWTQWILRELHGSWFNLSTRRAEPISTYPGDDPDSVRLAYPSEGGSHSAEGRPLRPWMLRLTAYAERLIDGLEGLDWPEEIKRQQRAWIGRSEGAEVHFTLPGHHEPITVFTTRPDTLYGVTYLVLAPEHPLVDALTSEAQRAEVEDYRSRAARPNDPERAALAQEKTGVFLGSFARNPVNGEAIPIWMADYVLPGYGTGAVMAVPAHDERDWEFARRYALPIREVVSPTPRLGLGGESPCAAEPLECFSGEGYAIHSGPLDGLPTADAQHEIVLRLQKAGLGRPAVVYKLRDGLYFERSTSETDGRDTSLGSRWAGACWHHLRCCDPHNAERFVGRAAERYWMAGELAGPLSRANEDAGPGIKARPGGVELYVAEAEHAGLPLLSTRFWHQVLFDLGHVSTPEPFQRLVAPGAILGEGEPDPSKPGADGSSEMSHPRQSPIDPGDAISEFGADALRCYAMFAGPLEQAKPWSLTGVEGVSRFLARVWRLAMVEDQTGAWVPGPGVSAELAPAKATLKTMHGAIKKVTADLEALSLNTALAELMKYVNHFTGLQPRPAAGLRLLLQLLNPFAPHLAEELWQRLGFETDGPLAEAPWPEHDEQWLIDDEIELPLQVNGKVRDRITVKKEASREEVEAVTLGRVRLREWTAGKTVKKIVVVPGKLVNVVVG